MNSCERNGFDGGFGGYGGGCLWRWKVHSIIGAFDAPWYTRPIQLGGSRRTNSSDRIVDYIECLPSY